MLARDRNVEANVDDDVVATRDQLLWYNLKHRLPRFKHFSRRSELPRLFRVHIHSRVPTGLFAVLWQLTAAIGATPGDPGRPVRDTLADVDESFGGKLLLRLKEQVTRVKIERDEVPEDVEGLKAVQNSSLWWNGTQSKLCSLDQRT